MPTGNLVFYIEVAGVPGPQGSKKSIGNNRMIESSKKVGPWRKAVAKEALASLPDDWEILDGPLHTEIVFHLPRPKTRPRTLDVPATRYPDLSKLVRSTEDALTQVGVWADDARVVSMMATKRYSVGPDLPKIHNPWVHRPVGATIKVYRA